MAKPLTVPQTSTSSPRLVGRSPPSLRHRFWLLLASFTGLCLVFFTLTRPFSPRLLACDVGQGDGLILIYGSVAVLLDSGPNQAILRCLAQELPFGQTKLAAAVLSHWDADHIGGFSDVAGRYGVGSIFVNPKTKDTKAAQKVAGAIEQRGGGVEVFPGDELAFPGGRLRFVWSAAAAHSASTAEIDDQQENNRSIGVLGAFLGFGFLGLGDLECQSELAVSSLHLLTSTPILKVSHHGSKFSTCPEFLAKIQPEIAILSVGEGNQYGHPAAEVLQNLADFGVAALRTDQAGAWEIKRGVAGWDLSSEREF